MAKKGAELEILVIDFLENIFTELDYKVVRKRIQNSGSQDGYDNLVEIVDNKYRSYYIYCECKDYTTELSYTGAIIKLPQLSSTHIDIDLMLFVSPKRKFSNIFEETRNKPFLESLSNNKFKVTFLSPETYVQEYFSLYPSIYKKIYLSDAPKLSHKHRIILLDKFEKFIFSSRNLSKIIIEDKDEEKFIGKINKDTYHIERTIRTSQNRELYFKKEADTITIKNFIQTCKLGFVLLGNPGYGKSNELKNLALELWQMRNQNNLIPIFFVLKNFSSASTIEALLPSNYKYIHNIVLILDGVDEIENIIDFCNKLRNFIFDNSNYIKKSRLKFIISCRTNVYKKFIKNINDFDVAFLDEVELSKSIEFLIKKFNLDIREYVNFDTYDNREILENPFYLELIGKHYQNYNSLLTNKAKLIEEYVQSRLKEDKFDKYQNDINYDIDKVDSYTQKTAFALEAMQKPYLTSSEIKRILKIEEKEFSKNPFLEENLDGSWSFVQKNIQEYFVSRILKNLPFDEIINLVSIDLNTKKIHPNWHNVIAFLLNLELEKNIYDELIKWLLANDFELLFNVDSDKITDDIRSKVLNDFFTKKCVEETLWINDTKKVASFSQSESNIKYLIKKIKNKKIHRRARISAVSLLSHMEVGHDHHKELKKIILSIIKEDHLPDEDYIFLKQDIISLSKTLRLNNDVDFFDKLISILKNTDNKEIVSAIINSAPTKSVENNIQYFLEILDKAIGNKEWKNISRHQSLYSRKEGIFNLFEKITQPNTLLVIYSFLIERHNNYELRENLIKNFSKHFEEILKDRTEFHERLTTIICHAVIHDKIRYFEDQIFIKIIKSCKIEHQVFHKVLNKITGNSFSKHLLSYIVKEEYFNEIINRYNDNILNDDFIKEFRNVVNCRNTELSIKFEKIVENKTSYRFKEKINAQEIEERQKYWKNENQNDFDTLFSIEKILSQINLIYNHFETDELCYEDIEKFYDEYYSNFNIQKKITSDVIHIFIQIVRVNYPENYQLNKINLPDAIESAQIVIMSHILRSIPENQTTSTLIITESHKTYIKNWCVNKTVEANNIFETHLKVKKTWNISKYDLCETIYKFQKIFKFNLDKTLLLNMLWFNSIEGCIDIDYMGGYVEIDEIHLRILDNLKKGITDNTSFCNHIIYCVENKLKVENLGIDIKSKVYSFLDNNYYYANTLLETYYSNDVSTLNEFLNFKGVIKNKAAFLDGVIGLLIKNTKEGIVEKFLLDNFKNLIKEGTYNEVELMRKLISANSSKAFKIYFKLFKIKIDNSIKGELESRNNEWQKYTYKGALNDLFDILELALMTPNIEELFGKYYSPLRLSTETIVNICKANTIETSELAYYKLESLNITKIKKAGGEMFYYYKLKNDIQEIYYNHKSKPYTLPEVLIEMENHKYLFLS